LPTFYASTFLGASFLVLAGRDFPKDALKILPFLVFLSPLPITCLFKMSAKVRVSGSCALKKQEAPAMRPAF
jgi:hypothetical protein